MDPDPTVLTRTIDAVRDATTLDEVVDAVVRALRPRFDLWYAGICAHPADQSHMTVLASWSLADSVFDGGAEISASISRTVEAVLAALREGNPVSFTVGDEPGSLVDHLLGKQGVASVVTIPLASDENGLLFLALGAGTQDTFHSAGTRFFSRLSDGIGDTVIRLRSADHGIA